MACDFWREAEGFAQSRVRAIVQTSDGYIWLGTDGGLVRFNGESFTAFTTQTGALKDNEVWALQEDDDGGLWIGTYGGGLTLFKDGQFETFTTADGLPDDVILSLSKDRPGRYLGAYSAWAGPRFPVAHHSPHHPGRTARGPATAVCGFFAGKASWPPRATGFIDLANGRFEPLPSPPATSGGEPDFLLCGSDGAVWVGLSSGIIERRKMASRKRSGVPPDARSQIHCLYEDPQGGVWAAWGRRIAKFQNGAFETVAVEGGPAVLGRPTACAWIAKEVSG